MMAAGMGRETTDFELAQLLNFRVVDPQESKEAQKKRYTEKRRRNREQEIAKRRRLEALQVEEERRLEEEKEEKEKEEKERRTGRKLAKRKRHWRQLQRSKRCQSASPPPPPRRAEAKRSCKRGQGAANPIHGWAMVELQQFAEFASLMGCPYCSQLTLHADEWHEQAGGFQAKIRCYSENCEFSYTFHSTSPQHTNHHYRDAPLRLVIAWGLHGIGYERMESVWALAGGVPPISRSGYAAVMKSLVLVLSFLV